MAKVNPQPSKKNETREPICLEIWCRVWAYKMKNSTFESCKRGQIPDGISKLFHCEIQ